MKLTAALTTLTLSAILNPAHCRIRGISLPKELLEIGDSNCLDIKDEDQCNASQDENGLACVWCKCSAVPSECLNVEQAAKVPKGVFDCADSTDAAPQQPEQPEQPEQPDQLHFDREELDLMSRSDSAADKRYDGSMLKYTLQDDEVDGSVCDPDSKSLAGYVDITGSQYDAEGENKHLFYWFFEKRAKATTDSSTVKDSEIPLIMWLTGGPGCSSTLALLTENGPCSVDADGESTSINPYSWTETAHVLWLDQPAGVGYSYGKENDYNEEMISEDAYYFLQGFYAAHPEYSTNPLYVVGESYGGHYAPAIAHKVWTKNNAADNSLMKINLAGLAVGNGLTDPIEQYKYYPDMAYNNSHGIKAVNEETYNAMKETVPKCIKLIETCNGGDSFLNKFACQSAFVLCNAGLTSPYQMTGLNPYDIRKECGPHPLCYDFSHVEKWLNLESTKEALHAKDDLRWGSCNMGINMKFHTDWMKDFSPFVADLINDGIPALIYAGDVDFICNYLGNRAWTLSLDWKHKQEFNDAKERVWGDNDALVRTAKGFTFIQVFDAGHMVPSDQPKVALNMIKTFVESKSF